MHGDALDATKPMGLRLTREGRYIASQDTAQHGGGKVACAMHFLSGCALLRWGCGGGYVWGHSECSEKWQGLRGTAAVAEERRGQYPLRNAVKHEKSMKLRVEPAMTKWGGRW